MTRVRVPGPPPGREGPAKPLVLWWQLPVCRVGMMFVRRPQVALRNGTDARGGPERDAKSRERGGAAPPLGPVSRRAAGCAGRGRRDWPGHPSAWSPRTAALEGPRGGRTWRAGALGPRPAEGPCPPLTPGHKSRRPVASGSSRPAPPSAPPLSGGTPGCGDPALHSGRRAWTAQTAPGSSCPALAAPVPLTRMRGAPCRKGRREQPFCARDQPLWARGARPPAAGARGPCQARGAGRPSHRQELRAGAGGSGKAAQAPAGSAVPLRWTARESPRASGLGSLPARRPRLPPASWSRGPGWPRGCLSSSDRHVRSSPSVRFSHWLREPAQVMSREEGVYQAACPGRLRGTGPGPGAG